MVVDYAFASGQVVTIDPSHQDIGYGGCVQFTNNTASTVTIVVSGGYSTTLGPGASTTPAQAYVGRAPGRHGVTASSGPISAGGEITVGPRPRSSASPGRSPAPRPTGSGSAPASPAGSPGTGPQVAPSTPAAPAPRLSPPAPPSPGLSTSPPPTTAAPAPSTSSSPVATVVSGPIEPASHRGAGLPGAVAALLVVGGAAGWLRVMLAEPAPAAGRPVDG